MNPTARQKEEREIAHAVIMLGRYYCDNPEANQAAENAVGLIGRLSGERDELRQIFPEILAALGNGSGCTGTGNSLEFLRGIPKEVRLVTQKLRHANADLKAALEQIASLTTPDGHRMYEGECQRVARVALAKSEGGES